MNSVNLIGNVGQNPEILRLYLVEKLSMPAISKIIGIERHKISNILNNAGVTQRNNKKNYDYSSWKIGNSNRKKEIEYIVNTNNCHICTSHSQDGKGYPLIRRNNKMYRMSRYIYEQNYGEIPKNIVIRHKCDNPTCINLSHLEAGTQKENVTDMYDRHRDNHVFGIRCWNVKLTEKQVLDIRKSKLSTKKLSKNFNVSESHINNIKSGKKWKHLLTEEN